MVAGARRSEVEEAMKRLSQAEIEREVKATTVEQDLALAAKELSEHAENLKPKRQPIQNDWTKSPDRWLGVKGGPKGLNK